MKYLTLIFSRKEVLVLLLFPLFFFLAFFFPTSASTYTISGNVTDESNNSVSAATVDILNAGTSTVVVSEITDTDGNYAVTVNEGTYDVHVTPPAGSGLRDITITNFFVDGNKTLDILILQADHFFFSGILRDHNGTPVPGANISLKKPGFPNLLTITAADGSFQLGAASGTYSLNVQGGRGASTAEIPEGYEVNIPNFVVNTDIVQNLTFPATILSFVVLDPSSNPVPNADIIADSSGSSQVELFPGGQSNSATAIGTETTDASGSASMFFFPSNNITVFATPSVGSGLNNIILHNVSALTDTTVPVTLSFSNTFSGILRDHNGTPVPGANISLKKPGFPNLLTITAADGSFQLGAASGTYSLNVQGGRGASTAEIPEGYEVNIPGFEVNTDIVQDLTFPPPVLLNFVVLDPLGNPVPGADVRADSNGSSQAELFPGGQSNSATAIGTETTDASGSASMFFFPSNSVHVEVTPPAGSGFVPFILQNVPVTSDTTKVISLQFIHEPPITTATLSPTPNAQGEYSDPVTVTLSATAASGFSIANTYYLVDGGTQQTYTQPFLVTGTGSHTITFWSVDNVGVFESPNNRQFTIAESRQITEVSPAEVWVGLKNSDDVGLKFDFLVEAYKDNTLITTGQLNSAPGGSSGFNNAKLNTVTFQSFAPVDFPQGSSLSIKVYARNACTGSGHNSGTARLWYNDAAANSNFGATIDSTPTDYYLIDNFALSTSVGPGPKKTIDVASGAKCSPFKPFGTWTAIP